MQHYALQGDHRFHRAAAAGKRAAAVQRDPGTHEITLKFRTEQYPRGSADGRFDFGQEREQIGKVLHLQRIQGVRRHVCTSQVRERVPQFQLLEQPGPADFMHLRVGQPQPRHARIQMDRCRTPGAYRPPVPDLLDGVQNGNQVSADHAGGTELTHALENEYPGVRQQAAQFDALLRRGHEKVPAALFPEAARDRTDTQSVSIGLDHRATGRRRRRFAQGAIVVRQRVQVDRQDAGRQQFRVGSHKI